MERSLEVIMKRVFSSALFAVTLLSAGSSASGEALTVPEEQASYANRYGAYTALLNEYADQIENYSWQRRNDEPIEEHVALQDITGDGKPELLFMSAPDADGASLNVWGFDGEHLICMLQQPLDGGADDGSEYVVFKTDEFGGICICLSTGEENRSDTLTEYILLEDGRLAPADRLLHMTGADGENASAGESYAINEEEIDETTYRTLLDYMWDGRCIDLLESRSSEPVGDLDGFPSCASLTLQDAAAYLQADHSQAVDEREAYRRFISLHPGLFPGEEDDWFYSFTDIDSDGVQEMIVSFPAGVRLGIRIFTCTNGQVISLLETKDGASYGAGDIYRSPEGKSLAVEGSGGLAATVYSCYVKHGPRLVRTQFLVRDYKADRLTIDDEEVSQEEFDAALEPYLTELLDWTREW